MAKAARKDWTEGFKVGQKVTMTHEGASVFRIVKVEPGNQCIEAMSLEDGSCRRAHPCNYTIVGA